MLSREEQRQKNKEFWNGFKQFMRKIPSAHGGRINWLNYPTEWKDIYVRLEATSNFCALNFDVQPKDEGVREIIWEQLGELKVVLQEAMNHPAEWVEFHDTIGKRNISRIQWKLENVNYYLKEDEGKIYRFLKERVTEFDQFYQEYKDILLTLVE